MAISFTLQKMEEVYQEANSYYNEYTQALIEINNVINNLESYWKSSETYTYEEFKDLYKEKYEKLLFLQNLMKNYCETILMKKENFKNSSQNALNNFE